MARLWMEREFDRLLDDLAERLALLKNLENEKPFKVGEGIRIPLKLRPWDA